jgi:hypothetical protein
VSSQPSRSSYACADDLHGVVGGVECKVGGQQLGMFVSAATGEAIDGRRRARHG